MRHSIRQRRPSLKVRELQSSSDVPSQKKRRLHLQRLRYHDKRNLAQTSSNRLAANILADANDVDSHMSASEVSAMVTSTIAEHVGNSAQRPDAGNMYTGGYFTSSGSPTVKVSNNAASSALWAQVAFADASGCNMTSRIPETLNIVSEKCKVERLEAFLEHTRHDMQLYACASCGIRDMADTYAFCNIAQLGKFRLDANAAYVHSARPHSLKKYYNVLEHQNVDTNDAAYYYLIPNLMLMNDRGHYGCYLCSDCGKKLQTTGLPRFNVGNIDFGCIADLEPLTDAEELVMSKCIRYHKVYKFGVSDLLACKGHAICFEHDATIEVSKLPRTDFANMLGVTFIGSKKLWAERTALGPAREKFLKVYPQLKVDPKKVIARLVLKQALDPSYADIEIDQSHFTMLSLENLTNQLIDGVVVLDNESAARIDSVIESNVSRQGPQSEMDSNIEVVFVANKVAMDVSKPADILRAVNEAISTTKAVPPSQEVDNICHSEGIADESGIGSANDPVSNVNARVSTMPINEFGENDKYFLGGFPNLFLHGQGIPRGSAGITPPCRRHMLLQYDKRFSACASFLFVVFNQLQRHAAARSVSLRVKGCQTSVDRFEQMVRKPEFDEQLKAAILDPETLQSKGIARSIMNVCRLTGSQVPWSGLERQSAMSKLLSTMNYCGPFSFFVTVSPADMDSILMLRLADLSENGMPAINAPLYLPTLHQRHAILANNSFAAAQVYKLLIEAMFEFLFAMPIESFCNASHKVLSNRKCGILGVPIAYGGFTEAQGRHSAHMHLLMTTDVSPMEIARVLDDEAIRQQLSKRIDSVVQAWLPKEFAESCSQISDGACVEETSVFRDHRNLTELRSAVKNGKCTEAAYSTLQEAAYLTATCSNMHTDHKPTCQKGPVGKYRCRMAMPRSTFSYESQFMQLDINCEDSLFPRAFTKICPKAITADSETQGNFVDDERIIIFELTRPADDIDAPLPLPVNKTYIERSAICRNSSVVAFSPTLSAAFRCNTNVEFLGNLCQAKTTAMYAVKYVVKDPSEFANVLSLLKGACDHVASYPSLAEDSDSSSRYCKYLIQRLLNQQNGKCEWSQQLVSLALLNMSSNVFSHKFAFCFAWDAVRHIMQDLEPSLPPQSHTDDETHEDHSVNIDAEVNFYPEEDENDISDDTNLQTLNISTTADGSVTTVSQVDHYKYRGECFANLSLYEYCAFVQVIPQKEGIEGYDFDVRHPQHTTHCQQIRRKQCIPHLAGKSPPRHPGTECSSPKWHARAAKFAQYVIALHVPWDIMTGLPQIEISYSSLTNWIHQMSDSSQINEILGSDAWYAANLIAQARIFWINNISHGFSVKAKVSKALSSYRARDAHRFKKHPGHGISETDAAQSSDFVDENAGESLSDEFMSNFDLTCRAMHRSLLPSESLLLTHAPLRQLDILDLVSPQDTTLDGNNASLHPCMCRHDQQTANEIRNIVRQIKTIEVPTTDQSSQDSALSQSQGFSVTAISELTDGQLDETQNFAFLKVISWLNRIQICNIIPQTSQTTAAENRPPLIFISGAAGTGKTHFVKRLCCRIGESAVKCCAFTGNAASNLPGGNTIHSTFGIWPGSSRKSGTSSHNVATSAMLAFGDVKVLVIDEISLTDANLFREIDATLRGWKKNSHPFGGLAVIIMGDIFQIEAIGKSLVASSIDKTSVPGSLFKMFQIIQFNRQFRAETDEKHTELLKFFRNPGISHYPVYKSSILDHVKTLTSEDVAEDSSWNCATIIVSDNQSRCLINMAQARRFAIKHKKPIISWLHDVTQATQVVFDTCALQTDTTSTDLKREFPELTFYFVEGAPAVIKDNLSTTRGITNGTSCTLRSITLREDTTEEAAATFWQQVQQAKPGEVIYMSKPPLSVNVQLPSELTTRISIPSLEEDRTIIPMTVVKTGSRFRTLKLLRARGDHTSQCGYYDHSLDLAFAITYHKAQGRTLDRVLLVFNDVGRAKMTVSSLYVGLSRVRHSSHLRILSISNRQRQTLEKLSFRNELIKWWGDMIANDRMLSSS